MAHKDPEKRREYKREWYLKYAKEKNPNYKPQIKYYDFETHRELAMNSGIQSQPEWVECHQRGFLPDGIVQNPDRKFMRE